MSPNGNPKFQSVLDEIESEALDPNSDLPSVLRRCITLGSLSGSRQLVDWATNELKGYEGVADFPKYRSIGPFPIQLDGITGHAIIRGQTLSSLDVPEVARERLTSPVPIHESLAQLADTVASARRSGEDFVRLSIPGGEELTAYLNHCILEEEKRTYGSIIEGFGPTKVIERIYWMASVSSFVGILDRVRTTVVELIGEIRLTQRENAAENSAEVVERAVGVVIGGKRNRIVVNQLSDGATAISNVGDVATESGSEQPSRPSRVAWWIFGIAGVIACVGVILGLVYH